MNLMTLFAAEKELIEQLAEAGGEISTELEAAMQAVQLDTREKIDSYVYAVKRLESMEENVLEYMEKHKRAAKALAVMQKALKDRVKFLMEEAQKKEAQGNEFVFKLAKCAERTVINDALLPDIYRKEVTTTVVDKDAINADLKAGIEVPGVTKEGGTSLRIQVNKGEK